ncbi:MAG: hypothetical protein UHI85_06420 [Turicibacter sp.]|nr:hypothetical protein [Turicibacter sp.]
MVIKSYEAMKEAGLAQVDYKLYPKMRHEILNEKDRDMVYNDIYQWLEAIL